MNKKFSVVIALLMVFALAAPMTTSAATFTDVSEDHWAYEAVNELVAAGILSGYPDGTFKGDDGVSRYEIAITVSRALERVAEEREALEEEVDGMKDGFTSDQKTELKDIVKSIMEENMPEQEDEEGLNEKEYEQIANLIEALTFNYKAELKNLGADVSDLEDLVDANKEELEERIEALEDEEPAVTFSGSYDVDFEHKVVDGEITDKTHVDHYLQDEDDTDEYNAVDPFVYSNPWDSDSDEIDFADNKGDLGQTLGLDLNIEKDGLNAVVGFDVTEGEEDELYIDLAELELENDDIKGIYNTENAVEYRDYAFNDVEFNGATVEVKDYGINSFMGTKDIVVETDEDVDAENDDEEQKYEWDEDTNDYVEMKEDEETEESFFVLGAEKAFNFAGIDMNTVFTTQRAVDEELYDDKPDYTDERRSVLGLDANTTMGIFDANFDMAYSMPVDEDLDSGILTRMGVSSEMDMADVEFNFRNKGEDFSSLHSGGVAFDTDHDDYDKYVDGLVDVESGYNFTVAPKLFDTVDTEMFYGSVTMDDDKADTKMSFTGETTLMDIDLTGEYTTTNVDEDVDKENTMDFGAEYEMIEDKLTTTAGYTRVDPVEEDEGEEDVGKVETTMNFGGEYEMNDYISANADYETINNVEFTTKEKSIMGFGADIEDYPVFGNLTTSAGFDYETIGKDYDETTTEYNLGLGYVVGAADFSYDYSNMTKEGDVDGPGEGTYTTNEMGMTYEIVDGTDFTADYEVLELVDSDDNLRYNVKTATAGVGISF